MDQITANILGRQGNYFQIISQIKMYYIHVGEVLYPYRDELGKCHCSKLRQRVVGWKDLWVPLVLVQKRLVDGNKLLRVLLYSQS